jgi:hypothetical protein
VIRFRALIAACLLLAGLPAFAAFPTIVTESSSTVDANGTSHTHTLPGSLVNGNWLIAICAIDGSNPSFTNADWSQIAWYTGAGALIIDKRQIDGTESTKRTWTSSASERSACKFYQLSGTDGTVEATAQQGGSGSSSADPLALTPTGGAKDYLWFAVMVANAPDAVTCPTNYTANCLQVDSNANTTNIADAHLALGRRELNASSEDPGAFTFTATDWRTGTFAVHPSSAAVVDVTDVDTDESITATQTNVVITGTGFGASQGDGLVELVDGAITSTLSVDSWSSTSIQADVVLGNVRFGSRTLRVTNDDASSDTIAVAITAPANQAYLDLSGGLATLQFDWQNAPSRLTTRTSQYDSQTDIGATSQIWLSAFTGGTIATLFVNGAIEIDDDTTQIKWRWHNGTVWSSEITWDIGGDAPVFIGPEIE